MSRRRFLVGAGAAVVVVTLPAWMGGGRARALRASLPTRVVGAVTDLEVGVPQTFFYPTDAAHAKAVLVRLGVRAGMGVGPDDDIVAFGAVCPHQGGPVGDAYAPEHQVLGPCPLHLSTFDLTRHGMVVSGHATEPLPQVILETRGNDIVATGVQGLIFGLPDNDLHRSDLVLGGSA